MGQVCTDTSALAVSACGGQATDPGAHGPRTLGVGACGSPLLIQCALSRGCGGGGAGGLQLLWRILQTATECLFFLFFFWRNSSYSSPLVQTSTWPLTQPSLALSQESCSRPCTLAKGFSSPGPRTGPRDLIVLKHSSYHLIFRCPLQFLVSNLCIYWNTIGCLLWS